MKKESLNIFERLEENRENLLSKLDTLSDEQRHFSPASGKWNILQVALHVMAGEKLSVVYIKRKVSSNREMPKSGLKSRLRLLMLKLAFNSPFRFKAPKLTDATGKDPDYEKLKSDWQKIREDLKRIIEEADDEIFKSELFKHPRVGMLNMKQTLEFMRIHFIHHEKQIEKMINHPDFPSGE